MFYFLSARILGTSLPFDPLDRSGLALRRIEVVRFLSPRLSSSTEAMEVNLQPKCSLTYPCLRLRKFPHERRAQ